ncbi:MAG TPA: hypothetical protein VKU02_24000 [Gemmataceae bacterium]|nr:hypothetical protein [Gemmataceae bacterium]
MKTLLVMTVGQTDVQFVEDGRKRQFDKKRTGSLHDELAQVPSHWNVIDAPSERGNDIENFPESPWLLCTPKFDAALGWSGWGEAKPSRVLFLETTRKANKDDPRFAGGVLAVRAKDKGITEVYQCAYLGPDDRALEDRNTPIDSIVRREVVARLERAIREAVDGASHVVVAATGGMPEVKALVRELVRLHAPATAKVENIEVDDGARGGEADKAVLRERVDPVEAIRLRRHALSLVEKGNLLGAWGAVSYLEGTPGQEWTQVINWLAHFASSLPLPTGCDLTVLSHQRMAVRAALRVELALRAGDIPRAVHGTVAFFEAALWDKLLEHFERDPKDARWLKLRIGATAPAGKLLRADVDDDKNRPFESKPRADGQSWFWFHESGAGRFARDYVKSQPLKALLDAVDKVKQLRNDVAHNEPTPALMDDASRRMRDAQLWSGTDTFLSQPLVQTVLKELGEQCPEQLCINFVSTVRERLLAIS